MLRWIETGKIVMREITGMADHVNAQCADAINDSQKTVIV
jgi:ribosomal protein S18